MTESVFERIVHGLNLIHPKGTVVEVRILHTHRGTISGYFDDLETLARAIYPRDGRTSIYATVNPVLPELLARAPNRLVPYAKRTTADTEILRRSWFLLDVDSVVPRGLPATNAEVAATLAHRDIIVSRLRTAGWPEPMTAMSGNGGHAMWQVDLPNDPETRSLFERALRVLGAWFTTPTIRVDTSVSNAARIWKVYGTFASKGTPSDERPHRRAEIDNVPKRFDVLGLDGLRWLAEQQPEPYATHSVPSRTSPSDVVQPFEIHGLYLRSLGSGKHAVKCPWALQHTEDIGTADTSTVIYDGSDGRQAAFKCLHAHCVGRRLDDAIELLRTAAVSIREPPPNSSVLFPPLKGPLGKEKIFRPLTAEQILASEAGPIPWVWDPFLPRGTLALLVAFMKVGKSTFIYALALAVARGISFLRYPTTQGPVLIVALEEHPRDVRRHLEQFGMRRDDPIYVATGPLMNSTEILQEIELFVQEREITLVIIDTLTQFWNVADENSNSEVVREVSQILELARRTNAVVLLVHHERKSGGEEGRGIRGGSALFGLVDQALLLERRHGGDETHRVVRTFGRYFETPREVVLALEDSEYLNLGTGEDFNAIDERVFNALSDTPLSIATISQELKISYKMVRKALENIGDRVVREGLGVKAHPYTYRRAPNSFLSRGGPLGEGKDSSWPNKEKFKARSVPGNRSLILEPSDQNQRRTRYQEATQGPKGRCHHSSE